MLGGDIFRVLERVKAAGRRPPACINVDLAGGVSADASGLRFLSGPTEGVISPHRHVIELARETDLLTVHRLFAIDSSAVERGGEADPARTTSLRRNPPRPRLPEGDPSLPRAPQKTGLAGGLLKSLEDISSILAAGAAGVSTSHQKLWRAP